MDVTTIFDTARRRTYTTAQQYPTNANTIEDLNKIYHEFCAEIRKLNDIYFYRRFFFDTISFQNKYVFTPNPTATQFSIQKILTVNVKYQDTPYDDFQPFTNYSKWTIIFRVLDGFTYICNFDFISWAFFNPINWTQVYLWYVTALERAFSVYDIDSYNFVNTLTNPLQTSVTDPNTTNPIYVFWQDRDAPANQLQQALYLYPFTQTNIKQWIKIEAYITELDLTTATLEGNIMIERNYHDVLAQGLMILIYQSQGKLNEAQAQEAKYLQARQLALSEITDRTYAPNDVTTPVLARYE